MVKATRPIWQRILNDFPLGPEPRKRGYLANVKSGLLRDSYEAEHAAWVELCDMKLGALALRERQVIELTEIDWRGLALALALKYEPGFNNRPRRGRPRELQSTQAREARKRLMSYVNSEVARKAIAAQSTGILRHLAKSPTKLSKIDPYYADAKRQSFSKLKKDLQKAKAEHEQWCKMVAEIEKFMAPPPPTYPLPGFLPVPTPSGGSRKP